MTDFEEKRIPHPATSTGALDAHERSIDMFSLIASRWRDIAVVFAAIVALSVAYMHVARREYTASATLAPSDAELNILTGVSGVTGASPISLGRIGFGLGSQDPAFAALLQQLTSNMTAQALLRDDRVKAALYGKIWDARAHAFHPPSDWFYPFREGLKGILGLDPWHPPTVSDMQYYLSKYVVTKEIGTTELYSTTYAYKDPQFARYFLSRVLAISDNYLRLEKLTRAREYASYLSERLKGVTDLDQRLAILKLRSQQENFLMAASVDLPFSADINDPPIAPLRPTWPNLLIIAVITVFFGGGFAAVVGIYLRPYEAVHGWYLNRRARRHTTGRSPAPFVP